MPYQNSHLSCHFAAAAKINTAPNTTYRSCMAWPRENTPMAYTPANNKGQKPPCFQLFHASHIIHTVTSKINKVPHVFQLNSKNFSSQLCQFAPSAAINPAALIL